VGCGKVSQDSNLTDAGNSTEAHVEVKKVDGVAGFGNYCPLGSYAPPQPVPITLWNCPMRLNRLQLNEPLQAFDFQVDCKKKTIDVRSSNHSFEPVTWEIMPDGNFYFSMDGGLAKIKDDGAGHSNCSVPLRADMWGKIDCQDRDKPVIRVETVWWMGQTSEVGTSPGTPIVRPSGTPSNTPIPSPSSSGSPSPSPIVSVSPSPSSGSPIPFPIPIPTRRSRLIPTESEVAPLAQPSPRVSPNIPSNRATGTCKLPESTIPDIPGCYLHNITRIDQCS
jgi:hypothetical protein